MDLGWQDILALALVAVAAIYVAYRAWRVLTRKRTTGCDTGCSTCPQSDPKSTSEAKPFVSIERLTTKSKMD